MKTWAVRFAVVVTLIILACVWVSIRDRGWEQVGVDENGEKVMVRTLPGKGIESRRYKSDGSLRAQTYFDFSGRRHDVQYDDAGNQIEHEIVE